MSDYPKFHTNFNPIKLKYYLDRIWMKIPSFQKNLDLNWVNFGQSNFSNFTSRSFDKTFCSLAIYNPRIFLGTY